jgi:hypothetical protein
VVVDNQAADQQVAQAAPIQVMVEVMVALAVAIFHQPHKIGTMVVVVAPADTLEQAAQVLLEM